MSKKSGTNRILAILIDSTYLLPVFGIEVDGINSSDLLELRSLALKKKIKIYYSSISLIEVISKVAKESKKVEQGPTPEEIEATISIIEQSEYLKPIYPNPQTYALAYKMKLLGHKDMIDNILYATATTYKLIFLTIDKKLKEFIQNNNLKGPKILNHKELFTISSY